jgi:glyoxylase-like metal-dependent hydrolase (beta-lactamase superfamily II)
MRAIAEIKDKPITHLIYSHAHTDHIGRADTVVEAFPNVRIIAHKRTKDILERANDPRRPVPHQVIEENLHLGIGGKRLQLSSHGNIHQEGNIWIYAPSDRILMVVDVIFPGWIPFRRLAVSEHTAGCIRGPDVALTFDFDVLIGGHNTRLGNRSDVLIQRRYVQDIVTSIEEIMKDTNTLSTAVNAIDGVHGNGFAVQPVAKWALYSAFCDASVTHCADKLSAKYIKGPDALGGAETFNFSNCEAYFVARRPQPFYLDGLIQRVLGARSDPREVIADSHARYFGTELNERSLVPGDEAELGEIRFDDWLSRSAHPISESSARNWSRRRRASAAQGKRIPNQRSAAWISLADWRCGGFQRRRGLLRHPGQVYAPARSIERGHTRRLDRDMPIARGAIQCVDGGGAAGPGKAAAQDVQRDHRR